MAEFSEVMKQWRRFCRSHKNCGECEFDGKGICGEAQLSDVPYADIELRIMAWAEANPEPVYPTWREYIYDYCTELNPDLRGCNDYQFVAVFMGRHIPADIAQKLGLQPKAEQDQA